MGWFGSASGKQVDEFAKSLARELADRFPPTSDGGSQRKLSHKGVLNLVEQICNKAIGFKNEHKLGVYKKARLGNTFRWELEELGYDKQFVEAVTQQLVVYMSRKDPAGSRREPAQP